MLPGRRCVYCDGGIGGGRTRFHRNFQLALFLLWELPVVRESAAFLAAAGELPSAAAHLPPAKAAAIFGAVVGGDLSTVVGDAAFRVQGGVAVPVAGEVKLAAV